MTQPIQCCYSPHEQHIMDAANGDNSYKKGRERIYKILDRNQNLKPIIFCIFVSYFNIEIIDLSAFFVVVTISKQKMNILYVGRKTYTKITEISSTEDKQHFLKNF